MISVVVLQNHMDLLQCELGSSSKTHVKSFINGNEVTATEAETVSHITEEEGQEPMTIPEIKTEPNVSPVPAVRIRTFIIGCIQNCLPLYLCVLVNQKFDCRDWILSSLKKKNLLLHVKYHLQWNVSSCNKSNIPFIFMGVKCDLSY